MSMCALSGHMVMCQWSRKTCDQYTWSCVSGQERCAAHKCVIYRNRKDTIFNTSYLYNYWTDFYQIYVFYALHIYDLAYKI